MSPPPASRQPYRREKIAAVISLGLTAVGYLTHSNALTFLGILGAAFSFGLLIARGDGGSSS